MLFTTEIQRNLTGRTTDLNRNKQSRATLHTLPMPYRSGEHEQETITIGLACNDEQRNLATMLVNRMYSWRGYGANHCLSSAPHSVTFTASSDEDVVGTLTLTVDSPSGLAVDDTFKEELDSFRSVPGAKICELTKFAFDVSGPSKRILAALFHIIFIYGSRRYDCSDLFIEVNPRHCRFYEAMLGFKRVGSLKTNTAVDAPSQLMWLKVSDIRQYIDEYAGADCETGRSLYPYFFSSKEEQGIYARLVGSPVADVHSIGDDVLPANPESYSLVALHGDPAAAPTYAAL